MEREPKQITGRWVLFFVLALIVTNLANFLFFSHRAVGNTSEKEPTAVIKFEPQPQYYEPETSIFWEALDIISNKYVYPLETDVLIEGAVRGIIKSTEDPNVRFMDPDSLEEFLLDTKGSYGGIGVRIIETNDYIVVFEVFPDSPAERAGLSPGDRIIEAEGNELTGEGLQRAVEIMRGPSDTRFDIKIKRPGADEPLELTVEREEITVSTVSSEMIESGLGYIQIHGFDSNTAGEFTTKFREMEQSGLGLGLILDLRSNPGGLVDQAIEIAKLLVPEGEIVKLVGRDEEVIRVFHSTAAEKPYPIVALINEDTASASELLAGALQDSGAAVLVGETTYGKASVQQLEYLSGGNGLLLSIAKYFTPSGRNIDKYGIDPDYEVEMSEILRYYRYFHPDRLEKGDYGPEVEMLQMMLEQIGLTVDNKGYFDEQTSRVLTSFQISAGLEGNGEFDDSTWVELRKALDRVAREQDEQISFALDLISDPNSWRE
jgi:carboxyl-terminal processing protease